MSRRFVFSALPLLYLLGALTIAWQPLRASLDPRSRGMLPYSGSEEGMYMIRTEEALLHPFSDATNGVWAQSPHGPQTAGLEEAIGAIFSWSGVSAPWLAFWLSLLITPLILVFGYFLLQRVGLDHLWSLVGSVLFFWLVAFGRRYFHPGFSLPLVMGEILLLWRWRDQPTRAHAVLAGLLLGFSVGVYLWAWTFLFAFAGILCFLLLLNSESRRSHGRSIFLLAIVVILAASPTLLRIVLVQRDPFFPAAALRAGFVSSHLPESWVRSLLALALPILGFLTIRTTDDRRRFLPLLAMLLALAVVYNQQLVHGRVMSFSSHYAQYLFLGALLLGAAIIALRRRTIPSIVAIGCCSALLLGAVYDYQGRAAAFRVPGDSAMSLQFLRDALDALRGLPPQMILTDRTTADLVASYTPHNVVFTEYSSFLLIPDDEFIERACLSEVFAPGPFRFSEQVVYAEERLKVLRHQISEEQYRADLKHAQDRCLIVRRNPGRFLRKYGVEMLIWDKRHHPDWKINQALFQPFQEGEGWSIWRVQ